MRKQTKGNDMKKYSWKRKPLGAPEASIAVKCINEIKKKRKGITPQTLVKEASKNKSPLHNCFEWNDSKAAAEYRKDQARYILRMLVVEIASSTKEEPKHVRVYVSPVELEQESNTGYKAIGRVRSNEDLDLAYRRQLLKELQALKEKIQNYAEFAEVVSAIKAVKI